ncbi:MAG: DUF1134 domain-containing protein [Parcubacteria group bacterium]
MDRRALILSGIAALGLTACATATPTSTTTGASGGSAPAGGATGPSGAPAQTYTMDEIIQQGSDALGVAAESVGAAVQRVFQDYGEPTAYLAGEEASAALTVGARYGRGLLYMKDRPTTEVFWQGPSIGFDAGGNASRVFTLCYNLEYPDAIFRRFPGVEGSAYLVGGLGVNYQRAENIVLAPIRAGVGLRLGANVGYLTYSRQRNILPF